MSDTIHREGCLKKHDKYGYCRVGPDMGGIEMEQELITVILKTGKACNSWSWTIDEDGTYHGQDWLNSWSAPYRIPAKFVMRVEKRGRVREAPLA